MATKAEKDAAALAKLEETRAKLTELGVEFTEEETQKDLDLKLKEATKPSKKGEPISFRLKNGSTREFSKEIHGEDYADVADEFATTHADKIIK